MFSLSLSLLLPCNLIAPSSWNDEPHVNIKSRQPRGPWQAAPTLGMAAAAGLLRLEARLNHAHHRDDAYASLDVGYDASEADVRRAFISHSRLAHPDKWQQDGDAGLQATATALFAAISGASEVLLGGGEQRARLDKAVAVARAELAAAAAAGRPTAEPLVGLRDRVTEVLLELEWKDECHAAQLRESESDVDEQPVVVPVQADGKRGRRRARRAAGRSGGQGTFSRPKDRDAATRHLYLANVGPRFGLSAEALKDELNRRLSDGPSACYPPKPPLPRPLSRLRS